jgi:hypothetical protein
MSDQDDVLKTSKHHDLRTRTWRMLEAHGVGWIDNGTPDAHCLCGHVGRLGDSWHFHVADVLIRELGLKQEVRYGEPKSYTADSKSTRYVTEWKSDDE